VIVAHIIHTSTCSNAVLLLLLMHCMHADMSIRMLKKDERKFNANGVQVDEDGNALNPEEVARMTPAWRDEATQLQRWVEAGDHWMVRQQQQQHCYGHCHSTVTLFHWTNGAFLVFQCPIFDLDFRAAKTHAKDCTWYFVLSKGDTLLSGRFACRCDGCLGEGISENHVLWHIRKCIRRSAAGGKGSSAIRDACS
jgi:hypothetical protein